QPLQDSDRCDARLREQAVDQAGDKKGDPQHNKFPGWSVSGPPRWESVLIETRLGGRGMYKQVFDPVSNSLGLTAIFAALPLVVLFVLLGGFKVKAHWAGLAALATALVVGIAVYGVPAGQAFDSGAEGATFGLFPMMWIVFNAL